MKERKQNKLDWAYESIEWLTKKAGWSLSDAKEVCRRAARASKTREEFKAFVFDFYWGDSF